eukprot:16430445-Heterocapsa_arctica.AAC.1
MGQWAGIKAKPPREAAWSFCELACGMGGFSHAAAQMGGGLQWACDISTSATGTFNRNFGGAQTISLDDRASWHRMKGTDAITA